MAVALMSSRHLWSAAQDQASQHPIVDREGADEASSLAEEPLAIGGHWRRRASFFFGGMAAGRLLMASHHAHVHSLDLAGYREK